MLSYSKCIAAVAHVFLSQDAAQFRLGGFLVSNSNIFPKKSHAMHVMSDTAHIAAHSAFGKAFGCSSSRVVSCALGAMSIIPNLALARSCLQHVLLSFRLQGSFIHGLLGATGHCPCNTSRMPLPSMNSLEVCPALPCSLACPALPCPALCPGRPCPALPCPALPCPALSCSAAGQRCTYITSASKQLYSAAMCMCCAQDYYVITSGCIHVQWQ